MKILASKTLQEIRQLSIKQVFWDWDIWIFSDGFTLSDGQTCEDGARFFTNSHTFDPTKKITRVVCIISILEDIFTQINFYHLRERLVAVGDNDYWVKRNSGRREVFNIAEDE